MKIPRPRTSHAKHGIYEMNAGGRPRDFDIGMYDTIRQSARYFSNKYGRDYQVRKVDNKAGIRVVRLWRVF